MRTLPRINARYWQSLIAASVFGTNTGDFVSDRLHLGHLVGLPFLAALLALIFLAEAVSPWRSALFFWAAIITVRTAATNVGDAFHDFGIGFAVSLPLVIVLFVASVLLYASRRGTGAPGDGSMRVDPAYWLCMILAGAVGTIGGDFASFGLGLRPPGATAVAGLAVVAMLHAGRGGRLLRPGFYWTTLALIRTAGTAAGDALAHVLGLPLSTAVTGIVFVGLVVGFYAIGKGNSVPAAAPGLG